MTLSESLHDSHIFHTSTIDLPGSGFWISRGQTMYLFNNISFLLLLDDNDSEITQNSSTKHEPVLEKENDSDEDEILHDLGSEEFSPEEELSEDDINQESEEELLDIPTFLRRQAN